MSDTIQAQYENLETVSRKFQSEYEHIRAVYNAIRQKKQTLQQGAWIGKGADSFFREVDTLLFPGLERLSKALQQASVTTAKISKVVYDAESEAARLFQGQSSGGGLAPAYEGVGGGSSDNVYTVANTADWTIEDWTTPPEGVEFNGNPLGLATGIPQNSEGAQYQTLDNMDSETREGLPFADATWNKTKTQWEWDGTWDTGIAVGGDANSCGPVLASMIISTVLGEEHSAPSVFQRFAELIQENWQDTDNTNNITQPGTSGTLPSDATNPQFMTAVTELFDEYGVSSETLSSAKLPDGTWIQADQMADRSTEIITNAIADGDVVVTLVQINDSGEIGSGTGFGIGHFVAVDAVSPDGEWVRVVNPFSNQYEFYPMDYFVESMHSSATTSNIAIVDMPGDATTVIEVPPPPLENPLPTGVGSGPF